MSPIVGIVCQCLPARLWSDSFCAGDPAFQPIQPGTALLTFGPLNVQAGCKATAMIDARWKQQQQCNSRSGARRACGQRLRGVLEEYDISPVAFAEVLRISPQCVTNWSARGVPQARIEQLARLLSVSEVWLATGEGERVNDK